MKPTNLILGLAPWFLFSITADWLGPHGVVYGAALAGLGSLVLAIRGYTKTGLNLIDGAGVVTFGALTALAAVSSDAVRQDIVDYGRGGAAAVLALVMLVSAVTVPFTESIARREIDRKYWGSPVFRAVNRRISMLWAGLIAVMAGSHLLAGALAAAGSERPLVRIALNWVVPAVIVLRGLKMTEDITSRDLQAGAAATRSAA
jgi:hypothetical protein